MGLATADRFRFALLAILAASLSCAGPQGSDRAIPASTRIAFENDRVRVIEYHTGTEKDVCGFGDHTHPAHVWIMLTDAKLRIVTPDGKETFEDDKAGDVGWADAEHHVAENLNGKDAGLYIVEIKDADWKPSTGLSR